MKKKDKSIYLSFLSALLGVAIGFLGEMMPDAFKGKVESWSVAYLGISYFLLWTSVTVIIVAIFLWLVWREASNAEKDAEGNTSSKVVYGKKSVFIKENNGRINIK